MRLQEINNADDITVKGYTFDEWFSEVRSIIMMMRPENTGKDYRQYPLWKMHWKSGRRPEVAVTRWMDSIDSDTSGGR